MFPHVRRAVGSLLSGAHSTSIDVAEGPEGDGGMNLTPMKRIGHKKLYEETSGRIVGRPLPCSRTTIANKSNIFKFFFFACDYHRYRKNDSVGGR